MDNQDAINAVREAQDLLNQAIEILEKVARETDDPHAEAYIVDHLKIMAGNDHGFLSNDYNLDKWVNDLEGIDQDDDDSDYGPNMTIPKGW